MTEQKKVERAGAGAAETSNIAAGPAPSPRRRLTAARKQEAVLRVLRGEAVELVARSIEATAADVSGWRDAFLEAGASGLKHRPRDARHSAPQLVAGHTAPSVREVVASFASKSVC